MAEPEQYREYGNRHGAYMGGIWWCQTCSGPGATPHRWHTVVRLVTVHADFSERRSRWVEWDKTSATK